MVAAAIIDCSSYCTHVGVRLTADWLIVKPGHMGSCNSTLNDIELAGAFIGAGVATVASGGAAAAGAVAAAGSAGAYFATKKNCSKSKQAIVQATNTIIATAIVQSINQCSSSDISVQAITIKCLPTGSEVYENNSSCKNCFTEVFNGVLAQHQLERKLWSEGKEARVRLPIDQEYVLTMGRLGSCGIISCKACPLVNVSQANILRNDQASGGETCIQKMKDKNLFLSNLGTLIKQQLVNNQDVLAGVAQAFADKDVTSLSEKITNQISSNVSENFLNSVVQEMETSQIIQLNTGSSTTFRNLSQYSCFNVALESVTESEIAQKSISDAVFSEIATVINKQNTLNDVGEVVFEATVGFTEAISNVVGKVMLAVLALLGSVTLAIVGYGIYKTVSTSARAAERLHLLSERNQARVASINQF